jgi:hypothetical protein
MMRVAISGPTGCTYWCVAVYEMLEINASVGEES